MKLEVKYVYQQQGQLGAGNKVKLVPFGPGHIVEKMALEFSGKALCGADVSRIRNRKVVDNYIPTLDVCPACQQAWKAHPQSEWARWVRA